MKSYYVYDKVRNVPQIGNLGLLLKISDYRKYVISATFIYAYIHSKKMAGFLFFVIKFNDSLRNSDITYLGYKKWLLFTL